MGDAWIRPAQVKLVQRRGAGRLRRAPTAWPTASSPTRWAACGASTVTKLRCTGAAGDACLTDAQISAVQTLHSPYRFDFALANGVREYPGCGVSGEATPASGPDRRLERLVVGQRGAGRPAAAGQRHRLVLRQRRDPVLLRPRPALRRDASTDPNA